MPTWITVVTNNLKLAAVGTVAVALAGTGAAATTMTLVDDSTDVAPAVTAPASLGDLALPAADDRDDDGTAGDGDEVTPLATSPESDSHTVGIRPTDTHGYCVSTAVHAVTAPAEGGNLGAAKSAAAHSCAKSDKAAKADKPAKPAKAAKPKKDKKAKPAKAAKPAHATPEHAKPEHAKAEHSKPAHAKGGHSGKGRTRS